MTKDKSNMELIGAINDVKGAWKLKGYQTWFAMLKRVHQDLYQLNEPQYRNTVIHPDWYTLSVYLDWYEEHNPNKDLAIDKDLVGANMYGPNTCVAITQNLNNALQIKGNDNGLPTGVRERPSGKFEARVRKYYEVTSQIFTTAELAANFYKQEKADYLRLLAIQERNKDIPMLVDKFIHNNLTS